MELDVKQRVILLGVLAGVTGNLTQVRLLREIKEDLSFSEEESAAIGMTEQDGRVLWNPENALVKDVEIGEVAKGLIVRQLKEMDRNAQLADDHLDIVDLFPEMEE